MKGSQRIDSRCFESIRANLVQFNEVGLIIVFLNTQSFFPSFLEIIYSLILE